MSYKVSLAKLVELRSVIGDQLEWCSSDMNPEWYESQQEFFDLLTNKIKSFGLRPASMYRYLITVSFDDTKLVLDGLPSFISKKLEKVWIKDYVFTIEQRSEDISKYSGYHTHIYITAGDAKRSPAQIKREFYNSFKTCVDNEKYVDVKRIIKDNGIQGYLEGLKIEKKIPKTIVDSSMRVANGYEVVYTPKNFTCV